MLPTTDRFKKGAAETLADPVIQESMEAVYNGFHTNRQSAGAATENWDDQRDRGRAIKEHTISNLDYYLNMLADKVDANGGNVFFAADSQSASEYILKLAHERDVKTVIKSKSMVSEEMSLAHEMEAVGIEAVETDLGEYIIQLAGEAPYHIIAPAIHKSQDQVAEMFEEATGVNPGGTPEELTTTARGMLRETFQRADMSVTGVNFAVAESGSIVLVTNEGNGRMCTSIPRVHVAVMGMEKIVPSMQDLGMMLRILIRSATGQRISSYVTMVNGPRRDDEEDGPEEFHLVIVDNGRMRLLADEKLREALYCIRCGACLNACPVYRKVGGHSYGWVYPGPIGAVVSPVLSGLKRGKDLPFASSLCGACKEACPVRIDIPNMLLHLRNEIAEGPIESRASGRIERLVWKAWRFGNMKSSRFRRGGKLVNLFGRLVTHGGTFKRLPPPLSGWTRSRDIPITASSPFRDRFKKRRLRVDD